MTAFDPRIHTHLGLPVSVTPARKPQPLPDLETATEDDVLDLAANARRIPEDMYALTGSQAHICAIIDVLERKDLAETTWRDKVEQLERELADQRRQCGEWRKAYEREQASSHSHAAYAAKLEDKCAKAESLLHAALLSAIATEESELQLRASESRARAARVEVFRQFAAALAERQCPPADDNAFCDDAARLTKVFARGTDPLFERVDSETIVIDPEAVR